MPLIVLVTFTVAALATTGLLQEQIRRQVEVRRFGPRAISPWNVRYVGGLPWRQHKDFYPESKLRMAFTIASTASIAAISVLILALAAKR